MKRLSILFGVLFSVVLLSAQTPAIYEDPSASFNLTPYSRYFEDPNHIYSLEDILQLEDDKFEKPKSRMLNFGHTNSKFWIDIHLENQTNNKLFLRAGNPMVQYLNVMVFDTSGNLHTIKSGAFTPFDTRSLQSRHFVFDLGFTPQRIIIETSTSSDFFFLLDLASYEGLSKKTHGRDLFNGFFFGGLIAMLLYNLFIFFSIRDYNYLIYVGFIFFACMMNLRSTGVGFEVLWPNQPHFNGGSAFYFIFHNIFAALFTIVFLNLKKSSKLFYYYMVGFIMLFLVALLAIFFGWFDIANSLAHLLNPILYFSQLGIAFYLYWKGSKVAGYYLLAWGAVLTLGILPSLVIKGVLPTIALFLSAGKIGFLLMAILMSNALAYKINLFKDEKEQAQADLLKKAHENEQLIKNQNIQLEQKIKVRTAELQQTNQALEALNDTKDKLFSIIGHDLRKPAIAFRNITKKVNYLLKKEDFRRLKVLGVEIEKDALSLQKMTDNLLNWALKEKQALPHYPVVVQVSEVIEEIVNFFRLLASEKEINVEVSVPENLTVFADRDALHTILRNLTDNALKYTYRGGQVQLQAFETENNIALMIMDNGIGIEETNLKSIFQLEKNKSQEGTSGEKGTGLGLHLVQGLVALNQGSIEVRSKLGEGTMFEVILPKPR